MTWCRLSAVLLLAPALLWLGGFFVISLGFVVGSSFATRGDPIEWKFSLEGWRSLFSAHHGALIARTLIVASGTTAAAVLLGLPAALFIVRCGARMRRLLYALVMVPLIANSLILAYAWITLLRREGLIEQALRWLGVFSEETALDLLYTPWAVGIGMTYWYLPFMIYPLYASLERMDWRLIEAAADLGASRAQSFRHVLLPEIAPGLLTGCLLVFVQSVGTLIFPELLGGSKSLMLGSFIHQKFLGYPENYPLGSALAVAVMIVATGGIFLALRLQREEPAT